MKTEIDGQIHLYKWAQESNKQVHVVILENGNVEISFIEARDIHNPEKEYAKLTLVNYRAKDIAEAILDKINNNSEKKHD